MVTLYLDRPVFHVVKPSQSPAVSQCEFQHPSSSGRLIRHSCDVMIGVELDLKPFFIAD